MTKKLSGNFSEFGIKKNYYCKFIHVIIIKLSIIYIYTDRYIILISLKG